jgi:transcriptional regulator with XRE-family HTH domain
MNKSLKNLGNIIKDSRLEKKLSQKELAEKCPIKLTQTIITQLETGKNVPNKELLTSLCEYLDIPTKYWHPFTNENSMMRIEFEDLLSEFVGREVTIENLDDISSITAENEIVNLFKKTLTSEPTFDTFNRCLTFYGVKNISKVFFDKFLKADAFRSLTSFKDAVIEFQSTAIRLFISFSSAFRESNDSSKLEGLLKQISERDTENYRKRTEWNCIKQIEDERLPDLGFVMLKLEYDFY